MTEEKQFNYGGQAIIEGVMMRGSRNLAIAVRNPHGEIVFKEQEIKSSLYNGFWSKVPFVRGLGLLWDALGLGMRALTWSADVALDEEGDFEGPVAWISIAISMTLGIGLFFLLPAAAASGVSSLVGLENLFSAQTTTVIDNLIEGAFRLLIVIGYIWAIGHMDDVKRLWMYHGAEHKTINAYEAGADLTSEEVAKFPLEHPRCGTGFLLVVVLISIIVFTFVGRPSLVVRLASRVILIPVIAGIAYEYIRLLSRNLDNPLARFLVQPQLALQKLTTSEPTSEIIEVAIFALKKVLAAEKGETFEPEMVAVAEGEPVPVGDTS